MTITDTLADVYYGDEKRLGADLSDALQHIETNRWIVAPDCSLGMLERAIVLAKMTNEGEYRKTGMRGGVRPHAYLFSG